MKVIGLTGGIGSGKSVVARIFGCMGIPVFDADKHANSLYETDSELLREVAARFGSHMLTAEGKLNRQALASVVFSDEQALMALNALVHPRVGRKFLEWMGQQSGNVVIREAAILFESGSNTDCDAVILVSAPLQMRIERVMLRNGLNESEVRTRISRQWPEEILRKLSDVEIVNDERSLLIPQVLKVARQMGIG
jgi:dephospho-CoA kinase